MDSSIFVLIGFAAFFAAGIAVLIATRRAEARRRSAYQALAERRAWGYEFRRAQGSRPAEVRFTDPARGLGLIVTRRLSRKSGSTTTTRGGHTVVELKEPRLSGGLALYVPPSEAEMVKAASSVLGIFDNSIGKFLIGRLAGEDIGDHVGQLVGQPVPEGVPVAIMATVDPSLWIDATAMARALAAAPGDKAMVLVSATGTRLRIGQPLYAPEDIEQLFDAALALDAALNRTPA